MKKNTLACMFIYSAISTVVAQTSLTPDVSPNTYIETPTYSAEYVSSLLERIVELEVHTASLETRVLQLERYINAYTYPSTTAATQQAAAEQNTVQQATNPQTTTQQTTTQEVPTQQTTTQQADYQQTTTQQATTQQTDTNSSYSTDSYYLQVGAYQRSDLGLQQKQRLEEHGYNVYERTDGSIYRLYLGPFPNSEVDGIQARLKELGIDSFPVR